MPPMDPNNPDTILAFLCDEVQAIHDALDHGASEADGYFLSRGEPLDDQQFWSYLVRRNACKWLDQARGRTFERVHLSLAGIHIVRDGIHIRVFKSRDGNAPRPGSSTSQDYYSQISLLPEEVTNLIFDWQTDSERNLTCYLSQPMGTIGVSRTPLLVWRHRLGALAQGVAPTFAAAADEADSVGLVIDSSEFMEASSL